MPTVNDIRWFKEQFGVEIEAALVGTPFTLDMITAIACQETGFIWRVLRTKGLDRQRILELCVGDTLDSSAGRRAFPRTKSDLLAAPNGERMFAIARQSLLDMAEHVPGYRAVARRANKFCHGFGLFQYDLQFFRVDPDYFLHRSWMQFDRTLGRCLDELRRGLVKVGLRDRTSITDLEFAAVAIAYNTGGFRPSKGLKQGHKAGGKYYGEMIFDFLRLSKTVAVAGSPPPITPPSPGTAPLPPPTPVDGVGKLYEVDVRDEALRLRREPSIDRNRPTANVIARLPDGQLVRAVTGRKVGDFLEIETSLAGAHLRGFASAKFLKAVPGVVAVPVVEPLVTPPTSGVVAVTMPRRPGTTTARSGLATAHSLNEARMPARKGATPDELRTELAAIVDWLAVDKPSHLRYKPRAGLTFCNIYAHDYCMLAGVYLPRVWWTPGSIEALTLGRAVEPRLDTTIAEIRANGLFRWLRDFGPRFGWRQTGTLTKLQTEVNQGAIGLIVARRTEDGRSGHIVMVVPETEAKRARRNAAGDVVAPLQSQAGATNFRYGTGTVDWWRHEKYAESAFWLHA